jgi:hypothetical protein
MTDRVVSTDAQPETVWWMVGDDDLTEARDALSVAVKAQDDRCDATGCICGDYPESRCSRVYADALHSLDSGMHRAGDKSDLLVEIELRDRRIAALSNTCRDLRQLLTGNSRP